MQEQVNYHVCPQPDQVVSIVDMLRAEFGIPFTLFDSATGKAVSDADSASYACFDRPVTPSLVQQISTHGRARVFSLPGNRYRLSLPIHSARGVCYVAIGETEGLVGNPDVFPARAAREQAMLEGWLQAVGERIRLADQLLARCRTEDVAPSWEALLSVDQAARGLRLNAGHRKNQQRILEATSKLVPAKTFLWVPLDPEQPLLTEGENCLKAEECRQLTVALAQSPDFRTSTPILCNEAHSTSWGSNFPNVCTLMAFQVTDKRPLGWFIVLNKKDEAPFRRSDAALLLPFVALLELHLRWSCRHQDLKDLLVGLTRSLTTAIDAKDTYTYGHSERVARTAVELGRELGLGADELGDVYLAGLLHDVGKIGIRDTVLHKPSGLTPEEQEHIQQHVMIGYSILADLRQIRNLLPGVLYHHERFDGKGYPDGLAGEEIPLLARILAVADAYDAMSHPRPYRDSMPYRKVEEILSQGAGTQWDQRVVDAFFRCRQRIHAIRQRGVGDSLRQAIDGALRVHANSKRPSSGLFKPLLEQTQSEVAAHGRGLT